MSEPTKILFEGQHLRLMQRGRWEFVERRRISGIVGIVALTDVGDLLLVEQYRPPLGCHVLELPAGLAGDTDATCDECLETAARRELLEETGYEAQSLVPLFHGAASAGLTNEMITCFLAQGLRKAGSGGGEEDERIALHEVPLPQIHDWLNQRVQQGAAVDYKVFAALELLRHQQVGAVRGGD